MTQTVMFELAKKLKELKDTKNDLEARLKEINFGAGFFSP